MAEDPETEGGASAEASAAAPEALRASAAAPEALGAAKAPEVPLPVMPGFREMALRRMAEQRGELVRELAAQRQAAGLSQTEVAAKMGTSQSAVARLESGIADVRASTLERYAAAIGTEITWRTM